MFTLTASGMKNSVWKAGYIRPNEERHTLSIPNPFFLGFDTDIAFWGLDSCLCPWST